MTTIHEIEDAVAHLPEDDLRRFREWFEEFVSDLWDRQIETDAKAGKLDKIADQALKDYRAGRCTEL